MCVCVIERERENESVRKRGREIIRETQSEREKE